MVSAAQCDTAFTGKPGHEVFVFSLRNKQMMMLHCFVMKRHLKLKLVTQFPASNDEKYLD